jgi:hypothetical protein
MKPAVRILLPITNRQELDFFCGPPIEAILRDLPGLERVAASNFCLLATSETADAAKKMGRFNALANRTEVCFVSIDELVLDYPFDVVPSLAYMKGLTAVSDITNTAFVFLQHNLLLADGSLLTLVRRMANGTRVLTATYFRTDTIGFIELLEDGVNFGARPLLKRAIANFHPDEIANVVNCSDVFVPTKRTYWRCDDSTLVCRDLSPSLLALRPLRSITETPGFRDMAFAEALCPNVNAEHIGDSDELLGIECLSPDSSPGLSSQHPAKTKINFTIEATAVQREMALNNYTVFHAGDVPKTVFLAAKKIREHIEDTIAALKRPQPAINHPRWRLAWYLWAVRRCELKGGSRPHSPFSTLLAKRRTASRLNFLMPVIRKVRTALLGQVPIVTMLHPDWLDFRHIYRALRSAGRGQAEAQLYVADDLYPLFGRVFGAPSFSTLKLLQNPCDDIPKSETIELAMLVVSANSLSSWRTMVDKILPSVKAGGQIVLFHHNNGLAPLPVTAITAGAHKLRWKESIQVTVSVVDAGRYRHWLRKGYPIALDYMRERHALSVLKGGALFVSLSVATFLSNAFNAWFSKGKKPMIAYVESNTWTSVTIIVNR